jgi:GTPase SAR1 family protein
MTFTPGDEAREGARGAGVGEGPEAAGGKETDGQLSSPERYIFKVGLVGDSGVGKRTYGKLATIDIFDDAYLHTFGTVVTKFVLEHRGRHAKVEVRLMVWDVTAKLDSPSLRASYLFGVSGAIVMADASRLETVKHVPLWVQLLRRSLGDIPIALVLNKIDLASQAAVRNAERLMVTYSDRFSAPVFKMSAIQHEPRELVAPLLSLGDSILGRVEADPGARSGARAPDGGG